LSKERVTVEVVLAWAKSERNIVATRDNETVALTFDAIVFRDDLTTVETVVACTTNDLNCAAMRENEADELTEEVIAFSIELNLLAIAAVELDSDFTSDFFTEAGVVACAVNERNNATILLIDANVATDETIDLENERRMLDTALACATKILYNALPCAAVAEGEVVETSDLSSDLIAEDAADD
jgi:hypothetical protein